MVEYNPDICYEVLIDCGCLVLDGDDPVRDFEEFVKFWGKDTVKKVVKEWLKKV